MKFCGLISLRLGVFISVTVSVLAWLVCLFLYIPYILWWSPRHHDTTLDLVDDENHDAAAESLLPGQDYGSGQAVPVLLLAAVWADLMVLAALYDRHDAVKSDLLFPWLLFYGGLILLLFAVSVSVTVLAQSTYKFLAIAPAALALFFFYLWLCVLALLKKAIRKKSVCQVGQRRPKCPSDVAGSEEMAGLVKEAFKPPL